MTTTTSRGAFLQRWNPSWTKDRAKKVARITAIVLVASWLLYVLVGNILVRTNALESLLTNPDEVQVDWDSGSTWWPGRFQVENFRLRTRDQSVDMQLSVADARFTLVLSELATKHVHFTRLAADGLSLRIRQRIDPSHDTPARMALLPDIEGFPKPPLKPTVRKPQKPGEPAVVHIEGIELTHAREVWIDEMRYEGDTHVRGSFWFQPTRRLAIDGAHLEVLSGGMYMGKDPVAVALSGTIDCTVQPFDIKDVDGPEILDRFDAGIHLDGRIENMRWVSFFVNGAGIVGHGKTVATFGGGAGELHAHVALFHGVLKAGTTLEVVSKNLTADLGSHSIKADVATSVSVKDPVAPATKALLTAVTNASFAIHAKGREGALVRAKRASLLLTSRELDLAKGFSDVLLSADLDDTLVDIPALDPYVATKDFHLVSGEAQIKAHADYDPGADVWKGESKLAIEKLGLRYQGKLLTGKLETHAVVPKAHAGVVDLSGSSVDLKDVAIEEGSSRPWWGHVDFTTAEAHDGPVAFLADLRARGRDARPFTTFFPSDLPEWVTGIFDLDGLAGSMKLKVGDQFAAVENLKGKGGDFEVDGSYVQNGKTNGGAFLVRWHMLTVGVDIRNDHVGIVPLGASSWFRDRTK